MPTTSTEERALNGGAITYLGHAGFIVEHLGIRVLVDPWFYGAFLRSWYPLPDNRSALELIRDADFDYLYISHLHEDHFDRRALEQVQPELAVIVPAYRSGALARSLADLGFVNQRVLRHGDRLELGPGFDVTMLLDTSHKEDSGALFEMSGFRFLDLNDCNTAMSELPDNIDILAAQFSGAMWYPNCYDYDADVMERKTSAVRADLAATLVRKVELTGARAYLPSAGPACFLHPDLAAFNDRTTTIFPWWDDVAAAFSSACPHVEVVRLSPRDRLELQPPSSGRAAAWRIEGGSERSDAPTLDEYRDRRRDEWSEHDRRSIEPVSTAELQAYFSELQRPNARFLDGFDKQVELTSGDQTWRLHLGTAVVELLVAESATFVPSYTLNVPVTVLRDIVDGRVGWEEALLSMRLGLHRDPDVFDLTFMSLLRYGSEPAQLRQMSRERQVTELIERDGYRLQRWCPHAGEDLAHATICDGVVECPRHHWKWDAETGRCLEGGDVPLRIELATPDEDGQNPAADDARVSQT
jgi:UDP-MurNAc hydroxylase